MLFKDRIEAGKLLARALDNLKGQSVVVFGIPRGGVVVGAEVARYLAAPLELIISRRISHPANLEYGMGAVTETGEPVWDQQEYTSVDQDWLTKRVELARREAHHQRVRYQGERPEPDMTGKVAVVVDDGMATGLSMLAAVRDIRWLNPRSVIVAVPVAPREACARLEGYADELVLLQPASDFFGAVSAWYESFTPITDEEVRGLIDAYRNIPPAEPLDLESINTILATIDSYPVSNDELAARAKNLHAPDNVVAFFESIPGGTEFENRADVVRRSEEVEILESDARDEPPEQLRTYEK